jgi:organic hydroperoxide reductase OsmC/OhrA
MSLAAELVRLGHQPERLDVTCRIVMDEVEGQGHQIVASQVSVPADVPAELLERADAGCPFSIMLRNAGVEVTISRT